MQLLIGGAVEQPKLTTRAKKARAARNKIDRQRVADEPKLENPPYEFPIADPEETKFRHGCWQPKRDLVRAALIGVNVSNSALTAFDNCGAQVIVEWSPSEQRYRCRGSYCHCRHCEPCARQKSNIISRNLKAKLEAIPDAEYRFITLSRLHTDAPLAQQIKDLYADFRKLRASPCWKATQTGGSASLEVKWQDPNVLYDGPNGTKHRGDGRWHPHLHVIAQGTFLDKRDLSQEWYKATGDSYIVDIKAIKDAAGAAYYVGKYVTKGTSDSVWANPSVAQEWITATKGVRACSTFGTWRGFALTKFVSTTKDWKPIAPLLKIHRAACNGDEWAIGVMINILPSSDPEEVRSRYVMDTGDG
jgi:hypothetical protein